MGRDIIITQSQKLDDYVQKIIDFQKCYIFDITKTPSVADSRHVMNNEKLLIQAALIDYRRYLNAKYPIKLFPLDDEIEQNNELKRQLEEERNQDIDSLAREMKNWFVDDSVEAHDFARQILTDENGTHFSELAAKNNIAPFISFLQNKITSTQLEHDRNLEIEEAKKQLNPNYVEKAPLPVFNIDRLVALGENLTDLNLSEEAKNDINNFLGIDNNIIVEKKEESIEKNYDNFIEDINNVDRYIANSKNYDYKSMDVIEVGKQKVFFTMSAMFEYNKQTQEEDKEKDKKELLDLLTANQDLNEGSNEYEFVKYAANTLVSGKHQKINSNENPEMVKFVKENFAAISNFFYSKLGQEKVNNIIKKQEAPKYSDVLIENMDNGGNIINENVEENSKNDIEIEKKKFNEQLDTFIKTNENFIENIKELDPEKVNQDIESYKEKIEKGMKVNSLEFKDPTSLQRIKEIEENAIERYNEEKLNKPMIKGAEPHGKIEEIDNEIAFMENVNKHNNFYSDKDINDLQQRKEDIITTREMLDHIDLKEIFGNYVGGDEEYKNRVKWTIAAIAKGEKVFPIVQDKYPLLEKEDKFVYATKLVLDVLNGKNSTFEQFLEGGRTQFIADLKTEFEAVPKEQTVAKLKQYKAQVKLEPLFAGCNTPEERKERFSQLIDNAQNGTFRVPGMSIGDMATKSAYQTGKIASYFIKLMSDSHQGIGGYYGLNKESIKQICDSKLDGSLVAQEFELKFKNAYGKREMYQLSQDERDIYNIYDHNDPEYKTIDNKLKGIQTQKSDPLLTDALAAYARLSEIHSKRGFFYWLTSPFKNWDEYSAIKNCEKVLKTRFGFTSAELSEARNTLKDHSTDPINGAGVYSESKEKYDLLYEAASNRAQRREAILTVKPDVIENVEPQNNIKVEKQNDINKESIKSSIKEQTKNKLKDEFEIDTTTNKNNIMKENNDLEISKDDIIIENKKDLTINK